MSFREEDTLTSYSSHLYSVLCNAHFIVFKDNFEILPQKKDDFELGSGDYINTELLQAIGSSKMSIIIFSREYAESKWCLEELSMIMELYKSYEQAVLPIFYYVNPLEVRHQTSSFGEAFNNLIQRISPPEAQVSKWRTALATAGGIAGFVVRGSRNEREIMENVLKSVCDTLDQEDLSIVRYPVGVDDRVQEVIKMLQNHRFDEDVVMLGIWGMCGIGKTTIARAIYNKIGRTFESKCFLPDIRKVRYRQEEYHVTLQEALLFNLFKTDKMKINSIEVGKITLRRKLRHKKVLVVLDEVDESAQLNALVGSRDWFQSGSVIIITTRDKRLLYEMDYHVYEMQNLDERESLELLSWHAFKQEIPKEGFVELSRDIVAYSGGLPFALEVLGSFLFQREVEEWKRGLEKLERIPHDKIHQKLMSSFDSLNDDEKEIFINIVLFYIGEDMNGVIERLDGRVCNASIGIRALMDQSLVTIDKNNKLRMHNLLQAMGREIIRTGSQNNLHDQGHRYEVFMSFRGEDTRSTFTSHLYSALCNAGIVVFKDDVQLRRGNHIKIELLQAIGSSKIAIIIFSKEYAGSKWCLEELSIIMEFHKSNGQVVLPVFYDVDPSEIRNQTSCFGKTFRDLIQSTLPSKAQVSNWMTTLADVGGIAGIVVLGSRDESEKVKEVVITVCDILDKKDLFVADHPVGVDDRVQEVITILQNHQYEDVVMVGIWGMGGIGKTTIAKTIYNEIGRKFDSRIYLPKIRKAWHQKEGKVRLQNQLLSEICKSTKIEIDCIESGKNTLRDRLCNEKALVVLDDVDKSAQLKALVGNRDWFKPGSRIIITTRNKRLLLEMDCHIYQMKNLDERESMELFSWHASKQESPKEGFTKLSRDVVAYSGRLPLALEVIGSYLFDKEAKEWERVLEKLKKIPDHKIQKKLKISFDALDDLEKEIFLDISCFFIGMDKNDVTQILNGCEFFADIGIKTLVERSLVTIDGKNTLGMHDLLRDMGREIIRKQSQNEPEKRSRLWSHEDSLAVLLLKHKATEAIEGLSLDLSQNEKMQFKTEAFKNMRRLRLLRLEDVQCRGDYKYISKNLRWLCWHGFPIKYIPGDFHQQELVAIDLKCSSLKQVWKKPRSLVKLKILNLSHSHHLTQTPDFSNLLNLETLVLKDCPSLSIIHPSIGLLHKLLLLDLEDCKGLQSLPRSIYRLKSLNTLILSGCVRIEQLDEDIEQMKSLTTLMAPSIKQAPFSLVRLTSLAYLSVCGHEGSSRRVIPSLFRSWMSPTNNALALIPTLPSLALGKIRNWIRLRLSTIPGSVPKQQSLLLEDGLQTRNSLCGATKCKDTSRLENCLGHHLIQIGNNAQVFRILSDRFSQGLKNLTRYSDDCDLPNDNYPYWLTFKGEGASVQFEVPTVNGHNHLKGMDICCIYVPSSDLGNKEYEFCINCLVITNYTKRTTLLYTGDKLNSLKEVEKEEIISNLECDGDRVEVKAAFGGGFTVKKMAIYLIYNESFDELMKPSTSGTKHKCDIIWHRTQM